MGETDYKDEEWMERDWEELHKAGLEGQRKRELMKTPEGREQLRLEREEAQRKYREREELWKAREPKAGPHRREEQLQRVLALYPGISREKAEELIKWYVF